MVRRSRFKAAAAAFLLSLAATGASPAAKAGDGPGYLLVTGAFTDPEKRAAYNAALPPIYRQHGGRYVALGGGPGVTVLAGEWAPRGVVLALFDSPARVDGFWTSPEYRAAVAIRDGGGRFDVLNLPGVAPPAGSGQAQAEGTAKGRKAYLLHLAPDGAAAPTHLTALGEAVAAAGGRLLVSTPTRAARVLEGAPIAEAVLVAEFASVDALRAFWGGGPHAPGVALAIQEFQPPVAAQQAPAPAPTSR